MRAAEALSMMNEMRRILNSFKEELAADCRRERKVLIDVAYRIWTALHICKSCMSQKGKLEDSYIEDLPIIEQDWDTLDADIIINKLLKR